MGIKGAIARSVLGLSLIAVAAPLHAQDDSDNVASTRRAEDRADARNSADPSELDRTLVDPGALQDVERMERDNKAADRPPVRRTSLGARALDSDADDDKSGVDHDGVDHDRGGEGAPKRDPAATKDKATKDKVVASKDPAKKEPAKKDADKDAKDKPKSDAAAQPKGAPKKVGGCVDVIAEARFAAIGYDHIVTLKSGCKKAMKCVVRTNVNAEPASVALPPRGEESVVMWRGSPAREFTPDVTCD